MALNNAISKQAMHSDLHLLEVWMASWLIYLHYEHFFADKPLMVALFASTCAVVTFALLVSGGFFSAFRVIPRMQDALLFGAAAPLSAVAGNYMCRLVTGQWMMSFPKLLVVSVTLAGISFCAYYLLWSLAVRLGMRRCVVLNVTDGERDLLLNDLASHDLASYVRFLSMDDLRKAVSTGKASSVDLIVISREGAPQFDCEGLLLRAHLAGIPIVDRRHLSWSLTGRIRLGDTDLWSYLLAATRQTPALRLFAEAKLLLEPLAALVLAILLAPVMIVVAVLLKATSKGPVLYLQTRTGYLGRPFKLVKFRSMYTDAEANGPQWASDNDSRVTPVGRFLRKTRLDELPQLWNVIRGEMSFVGPRPERPEIYAKLQQDVPLFAMRTIVRPGITGWAQVCAGYAASIAESQVKLEFDLYYIQHMSPRLDVSVIIKTIQVAIFGDKRGTIPTAELEGLARRGMAAEEGAG